MQRPTYARVSDQSLHLPEGERTLVANHFAALCAPQAGVSVVNPAPDASPPSTPTGSVCIVERNIR